MYKHAISRDRHANACCVDAINKAFVFVTDIPLYVLMGHLHARVIYILPVQRRVVVAIDVGHRLLFLLPIDPQIPPRAPERQALIAKNRITWIRTLTTTSCVNKRITNWR